MIANIDLLCCQLSFIVSGYITEVILRLTLLLNIKMHCFYLNKDGVYVGKLRAIIVYT